MIMKLFFNWILTFRVLIIIQIYKNVQFNPLFSQLLNFQIIVITIYGTYRMLKIAYAKLEAIELNPWCIVIETLFQNQYRLLLVWIITCVTMETVNQLVFHWELMHFNKYKVRSWTKNWFLNKGIQQTYRYFRSSKVTK